MSSHPCRPHRCVPRVCGGLDGRIAAAVVVARGGGDGADEDPQQNGKKKSWWPWPRRGEPPLWRWQKHQRQVHRQWPCPRAGGDQEGLCAGSPPPPRPTVPPLPPVSPPPPPVKAGAGGTGKRRPAAAVPAAVHGGAPSSGAPPQWRGRRKGGGAGGGGGGGSMGSSGGGGCAQAGGRRGGRGCRQGGEEGDFWAVAVTTAGLWREGMEGTRGGGPLQVAPATLGGRGGEGRQRRRQRLADDEDALARNKHSGASRALTPLVHVMGGAMDPPTPSPGPRSLLL